MARNPPAQNTPSIFYGTMDTLLAAGAQGAFSNRPSNVFGIERDAKTPTSYNYSIGVQRELGWGTVLDVTYAGFQMRNAEIAKSINPVPDGARFLDVNPQNANPQNPTAAKPSEFLRPYLGLPGHHHPRALRHGLQQLAPGPAQSPLHPRAAVRGRLHVGEDDHGRHRTGLHPAKHATARARRGTKGRRRSRSFTTSSCSYTWDVPDGSRLWDSWLTRGLLDGWQFSGDTAFVSGDWARRQHLDDRQLRLHRRRRRHAPDDQRRCALHERQLRSGAGSGRQLLQRRGLQPAHRTRRHRQRAGAPSTACRRSSCPTCRSSRTSGSAADAGSSSAGRPTTSSTRSTGRRSTPTRSSTRPASRSTPNFGQATAARSARVMQGRHPVLVLKKSKKEFGR